jgi:hypothetical protein
MEPQFPAGTPEHEAYRAELKVELAKFAKGEAPYEYEPKRPTLTVDEIALLREVARWRRSHGAKLIYNLTQRGPVGIEKESSEAVTWLPSRIDAYGRSEIGWCEFYDLMPWIWYRVRTVTQAVDVLAAIGFLPPRFSSAYRAGWDASTVWHDADECHIPSDEFKRLFHDPENVSFPASNPTW